MTETTPAVRAKGRGDNLSSMLLPELKALAGQLGITGSSAMRKGDLVSAIGDRQGQSQRVPAAASTGRSRPVRVKQEPTEAAPAESAAPAAAASDQAPESGGNAERPRRGEHEERRDRPPRQDR